MANTATERWPVMMLLDDLIRMVVPLDDGSVPDLSPEIGRASCRERVYVLV